MSVNSVDVEANFSKKPSGRIVLDDNIQPFGPSAKLEKLSITNPKYDHRVEKAYYDTDLKAAEAVKGLYKNEVLDLPHPEGFQRRGLRYRGEPPPGAYPMEHHRRR